jgi:hypothetical protein
MKRRDYCFRFLALGISPKDFFGVQHLLLRNVFYENAYAEVTATNGKVLNPQNLTNLAKVGLVCSLVCTP